jgi:hypothetical protein
MKMERRRTPRMPVNGLAYINLDPDNGGIILNVSEGGLSFQSRAPVHKIDAIRFWFSYRSQPAETPPGHLWTDEVYARGVSRFIEVGSELTWTDESRKRGGLRFKNLPEAAREQIRDWMRGPCIVHPNQEPVSLPSSVKTSPVRIVRVAPASFDLLFRRLQSARIWKGFSGGVISGILVSAVLVSLFSFVIQRHRLGDSLVQLGELLGGRSWAQPSSPTPPTSSAQSESLAAPIPSRPPETTPSSGPWALREYSGTQRGTTGQRSRSVDRSNVRPLLPTTIRKPAAAPDGILLTAPAPEIKLSNQPAVLTDLSRSDPGMAGSEKYLEIGKFKDKTLADKQVTRLSQWDLPVKVVQSSRFLGKSYQILVGPYESDSEAEAVHKHLVSRGFTARSYERGSRDLSLRSGLHVGSAHLPEGECVISWESYAPDAIVKIENLRSRPVTLEAKWVKKGSRYPESAIVYEKQRDGSLALLEIRFSGLAEALVLGK